MMSIQSIKQKLIKSLSIFALVWFTQPVLAGELVVFGDSLSDMGNLASVPGQGPFPPPFYEGSRVSNGPVAVEVAANLLGEDLSASLHLVGGGGGNNYAVAGARAGGSEPIDLTNQVNAFLFTEGGIAADDNTYIVLIGGNDIRDARDEGWRTAGRIIRSAVWTIDEQVRVLIEAGAEAIMVVNAPDLGAIPETSDLAEATGNKRLNKKASYLSQLFNYRLSRIVSSIEKDTGVDIVLLDLTKILDNVVNDAQARKFTNTDDACLNTNTFEFHPDCAFGANFDSFVFFDQIHPSARAHEIAGRAIFAYLPVPSQ